MADEIEKTMLDTLEKEASIGKIKADLEEAKANRAYNSYKKRQKQDQDLQEAMDDNIVKRVCKELGITQRELAERIGVSQGMPAKWAMEATPPPQWAIVSMNLLLENERMKAKLEKLKDFQSLILGEL
ncbi:helix-turn-helix domain-containing protein [Campylobacter concisus]|uniref:helix-turn-helix domain-containing protein n=1 Tax=Campylobacter concisus TaxID=199 RepID=UPI001EF44505|nr:helix-turn-helix transcriptional regulator [Campylobacter concisus]